MCRCVLMEDEEAKVWSASDQKNNSVNIVKVVLMQPVTNSNNLSFTCLNYNCTLFNV